MQTSYNNSLPHFGGTFNEKPKSIGTGEAVKYQYDHKLRWATGVEKDLVQLAKQVAKYTDQYSDSAKRELKSSLATYFPPGNINHKPFQDMIDGVIARRKSRWSVYRSLGQFWESSFDSTASSVSPKHTISSSRSFQKGVAKSPLRSTAGNPFSALANLEQDEAIQKTPKRSISTRSHRTKFKPSSKFKRQVRLRSK
jgi:hypothetical protein